MAGRAMGQTAIAPAWDGATITPDTPFPVCRSVYVGGTGDITAVMASGNTVTYPAVPVGVFPIQCSNIVAATTTATNLVALY